MSSMARLHHTAIPRRNVPSPRRLRLFSFISQNWRAKPLVSYRVIVDLIGATTTTTKTGLSVRCELDHKAYPKGVTVSDEDMAALNIHRDTFHEEWNYTIQPHKPENDAVVL